MKERKLKTLIKNLGFDINVGKGNTLYYQGMYLISIAYTWAEIEHNIQNHNG